MTSITKPSLTDGCCGEVVLDPFYALLPFKSIPGGALAYDKKDELVVDKQLEVCYNTHLKAE